MLRKREYRDTMAAKYVETCKLPCDVCWETKSSRKTKVYNYVFHSKEMKKRKRTRVGVWSLYCLPFFAVFCNASMRQPLLLE